MTLIDTHTHLYMEEFRPSPGDAVRRALEAGVGRMILPNVDLKTVSEMNSLHELFPRETAMAVGLHPSEVSDGWEKDLMLIGTELSDNPGKYLAVGEIGIDLYWDKSRKEEQSAAFALQCRWALARDLPVIIHCREALAETLAVLDSLPAVPRGVFHSFAGTVQDILKIRRRGDFYFGINGIVTFKNSTLKELLPEIGLDRILLETDSPYLAPVPHRGKRNESAYLPDIAAFVAACMGIAPGELARRTTENALRLFWNDQNASPMANTSPEV